MPQHRPSGRESDMKQLKRVLAIVGVILILGMYVMTMVFAVMKSEFAQAAFRGALGATILVPVFLYIFLLVAKVVRPDKSGVIDAVIFHEASVLQEEDGSEMYFRKDWEQALRRKGYGVYSFHGTNAELSAFLENTCSVNHLDPSRVLYVDADDTRVKRAQKNGFPAMRFTEYPEAVEKMEDLGIRL